MVYEYVTTLHLSSLGEFLLLAHNWEGVQVLQGASGFGFLFMQGHVEEKDHWLQFVLHGLL